MLSDKYKFFLILCIEFALWPFLWIADRFGRLFCNRGKNPALRQRIETDKIVVGIHEWGGYTMQRSKTIKGGVTFSCGLQSQLDRFSGKEGVELIVTMSEASKHNDLYYVRSRAELIQVDNRGMDFSGYGTIYDMVKERPNGYVILTNSSVHSIQEDFLDDYIRYMEHNPEVGMLGVSYCTKMIQTLVRDNFSPHLQSFFLLTTIDVLRRVVSLNGGRFPGRGVSHKLLLIRRGEIRLSRLVLMAGYRLAVVSPIDGVPYKFECYRSWSLPKGDIRQRVSTPNRITPIKI